MPENNVTRCRQKRAISASWANLTGAACATLVAEIAERHAGPVLIAPDIKCLCDCMMKSASLPIRWSRRTADWERYRASLPRIRKLSLRVFVHALPVAVDAARGVLIVPVNTLMQRVCPA